MKIGSGDKKKKGNDSKKRKVIESYPKMLNSS